jgi:hypothetical protein
VSKKRSKKLARIFCVFDVRAKSGPFFGFPGRPGEIRGAKKSKIGEKAVKKKRVFFFPATCFLARFFGDFRSLLGPPNPHESTVFTVVS